MKKLASIFLIFIITIIALTFDSCKKYEDGPLISFRSKKARVVGLWNFRQVIINGQDRTSDVQYDNIGFDKNDGAFYSSTNSKNGDVATLYGIWNFADNKDSLDISLSADVKDTITGKISTLNVYYYFKIKELKYSEIKLSGTSRTIYPGHNTKDNLEWTIHQ